MAVSPNTDEYFTDRRPGDSMGKGILFCWNCRHRSHYDDEWTLVERSGCIHYYCPNCHADIMTRRCPPGNDEIEDDLWIEQ